MESTTALLAALLVHGFVRAIWSRLHVQISIVPIVSRDAHLTRERVLCRSTKRRSLLSASLRTSRVRIRIDAERARGRPDR